MDIVLHNGLARHRRALKEHTCDECGKVISRLDYYYAVYYEGMPVLKPKKFHIDCLKR